MQASRARMSSRSLDSAHQGSLGRRMRHAPVRARVATLERKETFHADEAQEPTMQANVDVLHDSIEQLEASYQQSPVQRNLCQLPTAPKPLQLARPHHAHARQLRRARRSSWSAAVTGTPILETNSTADQAAIVDQASIGADNAEALRTIMELWHQLQQKHQENVQQHATSSRGLNWWEDNPPRLLTADEECILGTVIQQHRRLEQLYEQHPAVAAKLPVPVAPFSANSSSAFGSRPNSNNFTNNFSSNSSSSSSSSSKKQHGNTARPPALTEGDIAKVCGLSLAWRAMLPELSEMAQQLLVGYNVKLVLHMRKFAFNHRDTPLQDVLQAGLAGLKVAAQKYDPSRKTRFSTVAGIWILQALNRSLSKQTGSVLLPDRYMNIFTQVLQTFGSQAVANIDHRPDVLLKVSATFNIRPKTVLRLLKSASNSYLAGSLDAPPYQGPARSKGEESILPWSAMVTSEDLDDDEGDADGSLGLATEASFTAAAGQLPSWLSDQQQQLPHSRSDDNLLVEDWLSVLNSNEKRVMLLSYGLQDMPSSDSTSGCDGKWAGHVSNSAVGKQVGLTGSRVQQIKIKALKKLQVAAQARTGRSSSSSSRDEEAEAAVAEASTGACSYEELPPAVAAAIKRCAGAARRHLRAVHIVYSLRGVVPSGDFTVDGIKVGQYCDNVLKRHIKGRLQPNTSAAFETIAPGWLATAPAALPKGRRQRSASGKAAASPIMMFEQYYPALQQYVEEQGRLPAAGEVYNGLQLGNWVRRERWRKKYMAEKKRQALEQVPGWWWPRLKAQ